DSYPYTIYAYPHNMVLEILVSTGLVGLLLFASGVVPIALAGLRKMFFGPIDLGCAFAVALLADMTARHEVSFSLLAGRALFLSIGMLAAQCHPGIAAAPAWRGPATPKLETP